MTSYDPFAYGEVRLDSDKAQPPQGAAAPDHEDVLFGDDAGAAERPLPADGEGWPGADQELSELMQGGATAGVQEFGADVLGEDVEEVDDIYGTPASGSMHDAGMASAADYEYDDAPPAPLGSDDLGVGAGGMDVGGMAGGGIADVSYEDAPAAEPEPAAPATSQPAAEPMARRRGLRSVERQPLAEPKPVQAAPPPVVLPGRKRRPVAAALVPLLMLGGGGGGAGWLYMVQQDVVLGGIVGAASLVGAVFAWMFLRG